MTQSLKYIAGVAEEGHSRSTLCWHNNNEFADSDRMFYLEGQLGH